MALPDRLEPWYALLVVAFLVGAGGSLIQTIGDGITVIAVFNTALSGLLWAFAVYVFVGTFRNYVASYAESGGSLWDLRFLSPFVVGVVGAAGLVAWRVSEGEAIGASLMAGALSAGFWAFVLSMAVVLTASYVLAGYREAASERVE